MSNVVQQAGDLALALEQQLRSHGPASTKWQPEAIHDTQFVARLDQLEATLRAGLAQVQGMPDGFDRADRARALAQHAAGAAKALWQAGGDEAAAEGTRQRLAARAGTINDQALALIAAAGSDVAGSLAEDLAQVRARAENNRDNIQSLR